VTVQRLVDDHIVMYFLPPEHKKSLKGSLAKYTNVTVAPGSQWDEARDKAWQRLLEERWRREPERIADIEDAVRDTIAQAQTL